MAPENTLSAFRAAEAAGADGVELDVHLSRDGIPIVIHDADVQRTTDGRGSVAAMLSGELKRLDAGSWFGPAFRAERIPTLGETLDWVQDRLRVNVEIKTAAAAEAVLRLLKDFPASRVLISSFDHNLLRQIRQHHSSIPLGFVVESLFWRRALRKAVLCQAESLHPRRDRVSSAMVGAAHRCRLKIYPWTLNDPASALTLQGLGVDGIFTDHPDRMIQLLRNTGQIQ